jgi:broad specificity phosphatase PhoE
MSGQDIYPGIVITLLLFIRRTEMLLYITRHGETEWNLDGKTQGSQNVELTAKGYIQAEQLGKYLKKTEIHALYCSDLKRAYETAKILSRFVHLECISTPLLREVCFGNWEGLTLEDINLLYPGELDLWYQDYTFCPQGGGESIQAVQQRIQNFLKVIEEKYLYLNKNILIVAHALISKMLILELLGMPFIYAKKIKIDNTGLSAVRMEIDKKTLLFLNDTCHLNR